MAESVCVVIKEIEMKYTDYMICAEFTPDALASVVRELLADGWVPLGGVSIMADTWSKYAGNRGTVTESLYAQAMVKGESNGEQ